MIHVAKKSPTSKSLIYFFGKGKQGNKDERSQLGWYPSKLSTQANPNIIK